MGQPTVDPPCPECPHYRSEHDDDGCWNEITGDDCYQYVCVCGLSVYGITDHGTYVPRCPACVEWSCKCETVVIRNPMRSEQIRAAKAAFLALPADRRVKLSEAYDRATEAAQQHASYNRPGG